MLVRGGRIAPPCCSCAPQRGPCGVLISARLACGRRRLLCGRVSFCSRCHYRSRCCVLFRVNGVSGLDIAPCRGSLLNRCARDLGSARHSTLRLRKGQSTFCTTHIRIIKDTTMVRFSSIARVCHSTSPGAENRTGWIHEALAQRGSGNPW